MEDTWRDEKDIDEQPWYCPQCDDVFMCDETCQCPPPLTNIEHINGLLEDLELDIPF